MADNMERDKVELLTAKERVEKEEMKRELLDMRMYETWYTYKDMKQILGFINESKDMANMANDDKNAQKELPQSSNECSSETMPKVNVSQELEAQEQSDTSRSTQSLRPTRASPILDRISTHSRSSPEPISGAADSRNSVYRSKNLNSDDMFDNLHDNLNIRDSYSHNTSKYISLKSKNMLQDSHNIETKMDTYSEHDQKLERWQINPLDSCVSENDVPLPQPERPLVEDSMPFKLCKEAQTSEGLEKLLHALNIHLKETAELWHSWHRTTDTKFQWGSPIQVVPAKDSSDIKSLTNTMNEENQMEDTNRYTDKRSNKRKSTLVPSSNVKHSSSDEDETVFKKKKIQYCERSDRILRSHKEAVIEKTEKHRHLDDENSDRDIESMETENLEMEHEQRECGSPEILPLRLRKITPPNLRKSINKTRKHSGSMSIKGSSVHSSNEEQSVTSKGDRSILTDQEILIELEKDDSNDNIKTNSENIEIKPLPMKGLSHRIKNECMILERIRKEKEKKMEVEKEEIQKKEDEEGRKREEFYRKQIEERLQREKEEEEKEKSRAEKSKRWNDMMDIKCRKRFNEESREKLRGLREQTESNNSEIIEEDRLYQDDSTVTGRTEIAKNDLINNVNCPICNQFFPSDKIEIHAAGCEQYLIDSEDENINLHSNVTSANVNNDVFECGACSTYKTSNGVHYKEHIDNCVQRKQRREESSDEDVSTEINTIPSSPVRCYRPISEQTDSDIDYKGQFPSNSRTRIHSSKRRRYQ